MLRAEWRYIFTLSGQSICSLSASSSPNIIYGLFSELPLPMALDAAPVIIAADKGDETKTAVGEAIQNCRTDHRLISSPHSAVSLWRSPAMSYLSGLN